MGFIRGLKIFESARILNAHFEGQETTWISSEGLEKPWIWKLKMLFCIAIVNYQSTKPSSALC